MTEIEMAKSNKLIDWLLFGYVICLPIQVGTISGIRLAPSDLFLLLILFIGLGKLKLRRIVFSEWHYALLFLFMFGSAIALLWNGELSTYALLQKDIGLLVLMATYIVFTTAVDRWEKLVRLLTIFIWSIVIQNCLAMVLFVAGIQWAWFNQYSRLSGMLLDPNAYGGLLVVAFALHMTTYFQNRPLIKGFWGVFSLLTLAIGILFTFSRSAWIGILFLLLVISCIRPSYIPRIMIGFVLAVVSILILKGRDYIEVILFMANRPSQINARIDILEQALLMFQQSPIYGIGLGTFYKTNGIIIHNTPMWFLTEFGLIGFMIFLGFSLWFIIRAFTLFRCGEVSKKPLILGLLLAHIAMLGLSLGIEALYQRHWWFMMSMIAVAPMLIEYRTDERIGSVR